MYRNLFCILLVNGEPGRAGLPGPLGDIGEKGTWGQLEIAAEWDSEVPVDHQDSKGTQERQVHGTEGTRGKKRREGEGGGRTVGSKNELVQPYSHFETLVQAPLVDLVGNQEQ